MCGTDDAETGSCSVAEADVPTVKGAGVDGRSGTNAASSDSSGQAHASTQRIHPALDVLDELKAVLGRRGPDRAGVLHVPTSVRRPCMPTPRTLSGLSGSLVLTLATPCDNAAQKARRPVATLIATVLHLRGDAVTPQPVTRAAVDGAGGLGDTADGNALCWNGEVFGGVDEVSRGSGSGCSVAQGSWLAHGPLMP